MSVRAIKNKKYLIDNILDILSQFDHQTIAKIRRNLAYNYGHDDDLDSPISFSSPRVQTAIIKSVLDKMVTSGTLEKWHVLGERGGEVMGYGLRKDK